MKITSFATLIDGFDNLATLRKLHGCKFALSVPTLGLWLAEFASRKDDLLWA